MRNLYTLFLFILVISGIGCSNPHKAVSYSEDRVFFETLKKLEKKPNDPALRTDLKDLYQQAVRGHEDRLASYRSSSELRR